LYKRWQPFYDEISRTVVPRVEFVIGITYDLDGDHYFDPRIRNMIVLDDLMSTAAKDPGINDLFTEGSHHRNLSVVTLKQNLIFGKDPTQRRNCHYLVLFNNPVDRQPVTTLDRQMYPSRRNFLLQKFDETTERPYTYLLVDLKPTTPDSLRLRTDVLGTGIEKEKDEEEEEKAEEEGVEDKSVEEEGVEEEKAEDEDEEGVIWKRRRKRRWRRRRMKRRKRRMRREGYGSGGGGRGGGGGGGRGESSMYVV
jgi:hypothetical protein